MTSSPSEPRIRVLALVTEALRITASLRAVTTMMLLIVATCCAFIVATIGQTVRAEQDVLGRIDDAGTRLIVVTDDRGTAGITPGVIDRIGRLSSVEWVLGLGFAVDGKNSAVGGVGAPVPVRTVWGSLPPDVVVTGRAPLPGEGLVGFDAARLLGVIEPVGSIDVGQSQVPIVGGFRANGALAALNTGVLVVPEPTTVGTATLRSVNVLAEIPSQVEPLTEAIRDILGAASVEGLRFETSQTLADVRSAVAGELGQYGRRLVLAALGVGLALVALVTYAAVTQRRQDFGRRRALGASRGDIIALVGLQNAITGVVGALAGVTIGALFVLRWTNGLPDLRFLAAVAVLASYASVIASIPPAAAAAFRDPVRVLRVP